MPKESKGVRGATLLLLIVVSMLIIAPNRRKDLDPVGKRRAPRMQPRGRRDRPAREQAGRGAGKDRPARPQADRGGQRPPRGQRGGQTDLISLLAGQEGSRIFGPGGWGLLTEGVFLPGDWGIFGPGDWGVRPEAGRVFPKVEAGPGRGPRPDAEGVFPKVTAKPERGPRQGRERVFSPGGWGIFSPGGWGVVTLLAADQAQLTVQSSAEGVSVLVTGNDPAQIQSHLEGAGNLVWQGQSESYQDGDDLVLRPHVPREGRSTGARSDRPAPQEGNPRTTSRDGRRMPARGPKNRVSPDVIDPVSRMVVEAVENGAAIHLKPPAEGAQQLNADVNLQVTAVQRLAQVIGHAAQLSELSNAGKLEMQVERHEAGLAVIYTSRDASAVGELQTKSSDFQAFKQFLDEHAKDLQAARNRTGRQAGPRRRRERAAPRREERGPRRPAERRGRRERRPRQQ